MYSRPTNAVPLIMSPSSMSLSIVQWKDKRKLMNDILVYQEGIIMFGLYLNVSGRFFLYQHVLSHSGRPALEANLDWP